MTLQTDGPMDSPTEGGYNNIPAFSLKSAGINRGQVRFRIKSTNYNGSYGPFSSSKIVFLSIFF